MRQVAWKRPLQRTDHLAGGFHDGQLAPRVGVDLVERVIVAGGQGIDVLLARSAERIVRQQMHDGWDIRTAGAA